MELDRRGKGWFCSGKEGEGERGRKGRRRGRDRAGPVARIRCNMTNGHGLYTPGSKQ